MNFQYIYFSLATTLVNKLALKQIAAAFLPRWNWFYESSGAPT